MRRFYRWLTVVFAVAGLPAAQASDDVFGYAVPSEEALRCLSEDLPVAVKVDYPVTSCAGDSKSTFYLKVGPSGAEVSGRGNDWWDPVKLSPRKLSRVEGERILRDLTSAMLRDETQLSCGGSTSNYVAIVEWACGAGDTKRGTVGFMAPICSLTEGYGSDARGTYARAAGIRNVVVKALRQAQR
ncbi:hypothetical protein [Myxococcus sp. Y35]|uniref:hypothetical protein n=1 Tax=Pseudomyxococcus flavus TaxID=3115648 RepID=UPI003CF80F6C